MAKDQNLEEVLIARNNDTGQVGAVTGLNEDGTPKMTDVKSAKLSDLVKFSKGRNPLEAFMSNFVRQCKNPSTFGFFRVPADRYDTVGTVIGDFAKDPEANAEILKDNKVDVALPLGKSILHRNRKYRLPKNQRAMPSQKIRPTPKRRRNIVLWMRAGLTGTPSKRNGVSTARL